jgi:hypothetical protein
MAADVVSLGARKSRRRTYARVPLAALNADPRLRGETWRVLEALCSFADDSTGRCYPSRRTLAKLSNVEQRNLKRNLELLIDTGLVRVNPAVAIR